MEHSKVCPQFKQLNEKKSNLIYYSLSYFNFKILYSFTYLLNTGLRCFFYFTPSCEENENNTLEYTLLLCKLCVFVSNTFHAKVPRERKEYIEDIFAALQTLRLCEQYISRQGAKRAQRIHKKISLPLCKLCVFASNTFHAKAPSVRKE